MSETKALPLMFDLGNLCCFDSNPLPSSTSENREQVLSATARDCAQALINQLLSTCPISRSDDDGALQITIPTPTTPLPREKSVPKDKEKTKWERFAEKKGIKPKQRDGNLAFDETKKEWVPKYGYKGKRAEGEVSSDWLEEVDMKDGDDNVNGQSSDRKASKSDRARKSRKAK